MTTTRTFLRNGVSHTVTREESTSFLDVLRADLGIKTAGRGCQNGLCGACRVLVDGEPVNSCTTTLGALPDGARVEGYEDLCTEPAVVSAVAVFTSERPTRCTLCVPSLGVTAASLARRGKRGDEGAIYAALETAACMCTGRGSLRRALSR